MARRLSQMTEDAMVEGGRSAQRNMEAAGFSEDLKKQLEERVKAAAFRSEYAAEHSILEMPVRNPSDSSYHATTNLCIWTISRLAQAKEHERQPQLPHGQETRPQPTRCSACSTTPANQSAPHSRSRNP